MEDPTPKDIARTRKARETGAWAKAEIERGEDPEDVVATLAHRLLDSQDLTAKSASRERLVWGGLLVVLLLAFAGKEFAFDGFGLSTNVKNEGADDGAAHDQD